MAKRWRKQKAAQQRGKRRKVMPQVDGDSGPARGTFGGFRRLTQSIFGGGPQKPKTTAGRAVDVAMWVAVAALAYYVFARQCMQ